VLVVQGVHQVLSGARVHAVYQVHDDCIGCFRCMAVNQVHRGVSSAKKCTGSIMVC
jgi:hypothetical protein